MRIGVNALPLVPGQIGGTEMYTTNLLTHLTAMDRQHNYYFFVAHYNQGLFDAQFQRANIRKVRTLSLQGLRYADRGPARAVGSVGRRLPRLSRWLVNAAAGAHLLAGIRRHHIDVWFCPLINLTPRHTRLPSVISIPDLQHEFYPNFFEKDLLEWHRRRYPTSCREATKIITFSEFSRTTIVDRYGIRPEKVHVIPHGVTDEFLAPQDDSALQAVKTKYALPSAYAFYPAGTWPHKNHSTLLKALYLLGTKHGIRLPCVFTGVARTGHNALLMAAEELHLTDQIRLLGHIERRDVPLLYRGASLLVFPSLFEGFGLPLIEAMVSDCPIVCSNATCIPEIVGNAALLFDPRDPEAIADMMYRLLTNEELRRSLVEAGQARCRQFTWERSARETLKVLEEAASIGVSSRGFPR